MACNKLVLVLAALCALTVALAVEDAAGNRPEVKAPVAYSFDEDSQDDDILVGNSDPKTANWVPCNFSSSPHLTCRDCNTKLICLQIGGLLKTCKNPRRPHCNNGFCSATPSAGCPALKA